MIDGSRDEEDIKPPVNPDCGFVELANGHLRTFRIAGYGIRTTARSAKCCIPEWIFHFLRRLFFTLPFGVAAAGRLRAALEAPTAASAAAAAAAAGEGCSSCTSGRRRE